VAAVLLSVLVLSLPGCAREHRTASQALALSVRASADTGRMERLEIRPPRPARAWLARVTPAPPGAFHAPLPEAEPDTLVPEVATPPVLEVEPGLMPPLLRDAAALTLPAGLPGARERRFESVLLDVRVSEAGVVTDVLAAGGSTDSALVEAATACAERMRFYPARRGGEPVAVWCRQRFDFGPGGTARP
jgi:TonB family protein